MQEEIIHYKQGKDTFQGYLVYDPEIKTPRPAILVAHAWRGQDDFAKSKAIELAKQGYLAFVADVYGNGVHVKTNEEAQALMLPLFIHRKLLRDRICAAYETVAKHKLVDPHKIGAIGFCFGGLTVIELLRSGVNLRGVVSFHGLLGDTLGENKAIIAPISNDIKGAILILHGHDDPLVSSTDIKAIQKELTDAKVDWQMHIYGHAVHAFTNPEALDVSSGMAYNAKANRRSWQTMRDFFKEILPLQQ
jgi:dienelactone hydrolase